MDDFEKALPSEIASRALRSGTDPVLTLDDAKETIRLAGKRLVSVQGVEVVRISAVGLRVETYSGYEFNLDKNWKDFVQANNSAALRFLDENGFGAAYGYILTATSEEEFSRLRNPITNQPTL